MKMVVLYKMHRKLTRNADNILLYIFSIFFLLTPLRASEFEKKHLLVNQETLPFAEISIENLLGNINSSELRLLSTQLKWAYDTQPYKGVRIYHCCPLDEIMAVKIAVLHFGGAKVVATSSSFANPKEKQKGIDLLTKLGIEYRDKLIMHPDESFDVYMDCGAELCDMPPPKKGYIELTGSGDVIFRKKHLSAPVISVNSTALKKIETHFGTVDGFMRALQHFYPDTYKNKRYLIIGYGNIGERIVNELQRTVNAAVSVIDIDHALVFKAKTRNIPAESLDDQKKCEHLIKEAGCIVACTGVKNAISNNFDSTDLFEEKILLNMGGNDEYGAKFSEEEIINNKQSFNFALDQPTQWMYLDPVFYAHNHALQLLIGEEQSHLPKTVIPLPAKDDAEILSMWLQMYSEKLKNEPLILKEAEQLVKTISKEFTD